MYRVIITVFITLFFIACSTTNTQVNDKISTSKEFSKLNQTIFYVEKHYADKIEYNDIIDRTIKGLLEELDENTKKFDRNDSSFGSKILNENILYLKVFSLNSNIFSNLKKQITDTNNKKAIILDLRGNDGKSFDNSIKILDLFIDNGTIAILEAKNKRQKIFAKVENTLYKGPLYLLVNSKTSSSAELIAGTLKEKNRATLIGEKTLGDDVAINVYTISEKTNERITLNIGKLYLPSGKSIKDKVSPNVEIKENDKQLEKAVNLLNKSN